VGNGGKEPVGKTVIPNPPSFHFISFPQTIESPLIFYQIEFNDISSPLFTNLCEMVIGIRSFPPDKLTFLMSPLGTGETRENFSAENNWSAEDPGNKQCMKESGIHSV